MNKKALLSSRLATFAKIYIRRHRPYIIGITGSIGKTSCRNILSQTFGCLLKNVKHISSPKNFNSEIWIPLAILDIQKFDPGALWSIKACLQALYRGMFAPKVDVLLLEYGIDHIGDMDVMLRIARPDSAIFTWLDLIHVESMWSPDEILAEKAKLLYAAKDIVFIPAGLAYMSEVTEQIDVDILEFALQSGQQADISIDDVEMIRNDHDDIVSEFVVGQGKEDLLAVQSNLLWDINAGYTSLALEMAQIVAHRFRLHDFILPEALHLTYTLQPWRATFLNAMWWHILLDSTYNAGPKSMKNTIQLAIKLRNELYPQMPLVYVLWDMNELGEFSEAEHRKIMGMVSQSGEQVFLIGQQMTTIWKDELNKLWYMSSKVLACAHARALGEQLALYIQKSPPSLIVCKSSQWWLYLEEALPYVLANQDDISKLCRQETWWKKKKKAFRNQQD